MSFYGLTKELIFVVNRIFMQASLPRPLVIQEPVEGLTVAQHHMAVQLGGQKTIEASMESGTNARLVTVLKI